jgi:hypothetical protein
MIMFFQSATCFRPTRRIAGDPEIYDGGCGMTDGHDGTVAIVYPGDQITRRNATPDNNRLAPVFQALANLGVQAEPAVYHDTFCEEVRRQLRGAAVVLVWMNPIQDGRDRSVLDAFLTRCRPYFSGHGRMIDQAYQPRLPEGMVRCYLVHDKIVGFGHQAVNAFFPAPAGASPSEAPQPGPRLYHPPDIPEFQALKRQVEAAWVPAMQRLLDIDTERLPMLWDCDFLLGPKRASGEDTYVLCEINVSSVAPFPETGPPYIAVAVLARLQAAAPRGK